MTTTAPQAPVPSTQPSRVAAASETAKNKLSSPWASLAAIVIAVLWTIPTLGLFISSFRPQASVQSSGWWTWFTNPEFTTENYDAVLRGDVGLSTYFINTAVITIPSVIIPITLATMAAYAFAWMKFPFRNAIFIAVVGLLVIPLQSTLIPVLRLLAGAGIAGEFLAVWLAHTAYGLPFAVYLLRNYMGGLPKEVFESAAIDGANPTTAFFRLALPMSVPVIASLSIFQFLFVWNDLLVSLIYIGPTNPDNLPMTVRVASLVSSLGGETHFLTAAAFLTMILPLFVFLALQRYFVRGITGGAVKG
jgi:alpha-glucoside transport system permease protein